MGNSIVAQLRTPTDDELKRIRDLWISMKQKPVPPSTDTGFELQTYFSHAVRMVGIIAGLHPVTGKSAIPGRFPMTISENGVMRLQDSAQLCSAILSLWIPTAGS